MDFLHIEVWVHNLFYYRITYCVILMPHGLHFFLQVTYFHSFPWQLHVFSPPLGFNNSCFYLSQNIWISCILSITYFRIWKFSYFMFTQFYELFVSFSFKNHIALIMARWIFAPNSFMIRESRLLTTHPASCSVVVLFYRVLCQSSKYSILGSKRQENHENYLQLHISV